MTTGPGDDHYLAAALADPFKFPSDLADHQFDFAFAADSGAHEREFCGRRSADPALLAGFALAHSLDSINSYDHPIATPQIAHQTDARSRSGRVGIISDNASVHPLTGDSHPFAIQSYFRWVDRGHVKIVRRNAVHGDGFESSVACPFRGSGNAAEFDQLADQISEDIRRRRRNANFRSRGALTLFAELKIQNLKTASILDGQFQRAIEQDRNRAGGLPIAGPDWQSRYVREPPVSATR